jgi:hypothetical protein
VEVLWLGASSHSESSQVRTTIADGTSQPELFSRSGVRAIAVLENGKAALTLGADKKVKLWDLVKGKPALSVEIAKG